VVYEYAVRKLFDYWASHVSWIFPLKDGGWRLPSKESLGWSLEENTCVMAAVGRVSTNLKTERASGAIHIHAALPVMLYSI